MHVNILDISAVTIGGIPATEYGWHDGSAFYPREITTVPDGRVRLNDHIVTMSGPPEAFDFTAYDAMVADPPHLRDTDKSCFACRTFWRAGHLDHLDNCGYLARIDHLDPEEN